MRGSSVLHFYVSKMGLFSDIWDMKLSFFVCLSFFLGTPCSASVVVEEEIVSGTGGVVETVAGSTSDCSVEEEVVVETKGTAKVSSGSFFFSTFFVVFSIVCFVLLLIASYVLFLYLERLHYSVHRVGYVCGVSSNDTLIFRLNEAISRVDGGVASCKRLEGQLEVLLNEFRLFNIVFTRMNSDVAYLKANTSVASGSDSLDGLLKGLGSCSAKGISALESLMGKEKEVALLRMMKSTTAVDDGKWQEVNM